MCGSEAMRPLEAQPLAAASVGGGQVADGRAVGGDGGAGRRALKSRHGRGGRSSRAPAAAAQDGRFINADGDEDDGYGDHNGYDVDDGDGPGTPGRVTMGGRTGGPSRPSRQPSTSDDEEDERRRWAAHPDDGRAPKRGRWAPSPPAPERGGPSRGRRGGPLRQAAC